MGGPRIRPHRGETPALNLTVFFRTSDDLDSKCRPRLDTASPDLPPPVFRGMCPSSGLDWPKWRGKLTVPSTLVKSRSVDVMARSGSLILTPNSRFGSRSLCNSIEAKI